MADDRETRRHIMEAMDRLFLGQAERSSGALNIVQLAAEAGVKRWVLVNRHTDLRDEFKRRCQQEVPPALGTAARRAESETEVLRKKLAMLREENEQLRALNANYAAVINELSLLVSAVDSPTAKLRVLPPNWR